MTPTPTDRAAAQRYAESCRNTDPGLRGAVRESYLAGLMAEREWQENHQQSIEEVHRVLDAAGIPRADGMSCDDPECNSKAGHRVRELIRQRDRLVSECNGALKLWDRGESIDPDQGEVDGIRAAIARGPQQETA